MAHFCTDILAKIFIHMLSNNTCNQKFLKQKQLNECASGPESHNSQSFDSHINYSNGSLVTHVNKQIHANINVYVRSIEQPQYLKNYSSQYQLHFAIEWFSSNSIDKLYLSFINKTFSANIKFIRINFWALAQKSKDYLQTRVIHLPQM